MNRPVKHDVPDDIRTLFTELRQFVRSKSPIEIAQESGLAEGTAHRLRYGDGYPTRLTNKNRRLLEAYRDRLRSGQITQHHIDPHHMDPGGSVRIGASPPPGPGGGSAQPPVGAPPFAQHAAAAQHPGVAQHSLAVSAPTGPPTGVWLAHVEHYLTRIGLFVKSQRHALDAQRHVLDRIESDIRALCAVLRTPTAERLELPEMKWLEQTVDAAIRARHAFESMEPTHPYATSDSPGEKKVASDHSG